MEAERHAITDMGPVMRAEQQHACIAVGEPLIHERIDYEQVRIARPRGRFEKHRRAHQPDLWHASDAAHLATSP